MAKKRATKKKHPYTTPEMSPLFREPPYHYRDSTFLLVQCETDARTLRRLVPQPLTPNRDNHLFVSVADFMCSGFGHYLEMHLFTHVTFQRRLMNYSLYLILDNDVAIGAGRDIWGFPKKFGRLSMTMVDDVARATVERGGITVIESAVHLDKLIPPEELGGTPEWLARKVVPSVVAGAPPEVDQITYTELTDVDVREVYAGAATLTIRPSPADRFQTIPIKRVTGGWYYRGDMTLGDGEIAHDYLA